MTAQSVYPHFAALALLGAVAAGMPAAQTSNRPEISVFGAPTTRRRPALPRCFKS